jgi:hypothetical protein
VVAVLAVVTLVGRFVLLPDSVVSTPLHWAQAMERETAKPPKHAGMTACLRCHDDIGDKKAAGYHKGLSCEVCHGPALDHVKSPSKVKPPAPRDRKFCPVCHEYDPSRPTGFPQIDSTVHNPGKPCITCHDPHDPEPPKVPRECSACHGEIERTKSVSKHALIACTTCHTTPDRHKVDPRSALPTKPTDRAFCGKCHAEEGADKDAPKDARKIDLAKHGGRYLCWECHYPHLPEGRK